MRELVTTALEAVGIVLLGIGLGMALAHWLGAWPALLIVGALCVGISWLITRADEREEA